MKTGLVLEGGGMRGIFSAGVLETFLEEKVDFDHCIGVSAGACHACSYLAGQSGRAFGVSVDYLKDPKYCSLYSLVTTGDLFGAEMLYETIPTKLYPIDNAAFLRQHTQLQVVVTNCNTGQAEYPYIRDMLRDVAYVRASSSMPLVSRMVDIGGTPYLDGGIADSIPLKALIDQGCEKNVVVLTRQAGYSKSPSSMASLMKLWYKKYPKLLHRILVRHEEYNQSLAYIDEMERLGKAFVIRPKTAPKLGRVEKDRKKLEAVYEMGRAQAKEQLAALKVYLKS